MSWDYERSRERIKSHLEKMPEIEISKLEKNADLENLLSETVCRRIFGAHVYLDIMNFSDVIATTRGDELRRVIRATHIYERQVAHLVEAIFDGVRVHFQGTRLHAIFYRPIDDAAALASRAALLMIATRDLAQKVLAPAFPTLDTFRVCGGVDLGTAIGTQNGTAGERELLFLGAPANYAAKVLGTGLRLCKDAYEALPADLKEVCEEVSGENDVFRIKALAADVVDTLMDLHGFEWDRTEFAKRVEGDIDGLPLKEVEYSEAKELIDFESLSARNNKRVTAASIFADVTGFTKYIDGAVTDEKRTECLRVLHVLRKEFARVATQDFDAVRVQFQGDRMQALIHLPPDDNGAVAREAVEIAIALQSSMEITVKEALSTIGNLHLAVGVDLGVVIASRLGPRGHRDRIVIGPSVLEAAGNEERTSDRQIGIASDVYEALEENRREHFQWDQSARCYVATGITVKTFEWKGEAAKYASSVFVQTGPTINIAKQEAPRASRVYPARSYGG
jgi:class 3 adenylate cyclase